MKVVKQGVVGLPKKVVWDNPSKSFRQKVGKSGQKQSWQMLLIKKVTKSVITEREWKQSRESWLKKSAKSVESK